MQKPFNLIQSYLLILDIISCTVGIMSRNSLPMPISSRVFSVSSRRLSVSILIDRSLIHSDLLLVQSKKKIYFVCG